VNRRRWDFLSGGLILALLVVVSGSFLLRSSLSSPEQLRETVERSQLAAPFLIVILHIVQIILAPVPGQAISLVSGYLFGPVWGPVYSMTGTLLGSMLAILLARRLGRPLVEKFVEPKTLAYLDNYARKGGALFFTLVFLLPFLPDDVACFLAGLSPLSLGQLLLIVAIGRLPGVLIPCWVGAGAAHLSSSQLFWLVVISLPMALLFFIYRRSLKEMAIRVMENLSRRGTA